MMPRPDAPSPDTIAAKKMHAVQEDIFTRYLIACDTTKDLKTLFFAMGLTTADLALAVAKGCCRRTPTDDTLTTASLHAYMTGLHDVIIAKKLGDNHADMKYITFGDLDQNMDLLKWTTIIRAFQGAAVETENRRRSSCRSSRRDSLASASRTRRRRSASWSARR